MLKPEPVTNVDPNVPYLQAGSLEKGIKRRKWGAIPRTYGLCMPRLPLKWLLYLEFKVKCFYPTL